MAGSMREIEALALELSPEERAELAPRLMRSLDRDPDVEAAWEAEIRKRIADLDAGLISTVPSEEVVAEARRILRG